MDTDKRIRTINQGRLATVAGQFLGGYFEEQIQQIQQEMLRRYSERSHDYIDLVSRLYTVDKLRRDLERMEKRAEAQAAKEIEKSGHKL